MKYLVKANLIPSQKKTLLAALSNGNLGKGSVAFGEYEKNMKQARLLDDGTVTWVEVCFCATPLNEEMPYWKTFFENIEIENALDPKSCEDANGSSRHACLHCSCTEELEENMLNWGEPFLK